VANRRITDPGVRGFCGLLPTAERTCPNCLTKFTKWQAATAPGDANTPDVADAEQISNGTSKGARVSSSSESPAAHLLQACVPLEVQSLQTNADQTPSKTSTRPPGAGLSCCCYVQSCGSCSRACTVRRILARMVWWVVECCASKARSYGLVGGRMMCVDCLLVWSGGWLVLCALNACSRGLVGGLCCASNACSCGLVWVFITAGLTALPDFRLGWLKE
jgi:hypothetical protein